MLRCHNRVSFINKFVSVLFEDKFKKYTDLLNYIKLLMGNILKKFYPSIISPGSSRFNHGLCYSGFSHVAREHNPDTSNYRV